MPQQYQVPEITKEEILKINICVAHAHYANLSNSGTYSHELNKVLTTNNLPNIIIPYSVNLNISPNTQQSHTGPQAQAKPYPKPRSKGKSTDAQNTQSDENEESQKETGKKDVLDSTEIELHVYTTKEQGWPKANFTKWFITLEIINTNSHMMITLWMTKDCSN